VVSAPLNRTRKRKDLTAGGTSKKNKKFLRLEENFFFFFTLTFPSPEKLLELLFLNKHTLQS